MDCSFFNTHPGVGGLCSADLTMSGEGYAIRNCDMWVEVSV